MAEGIIEEDYALFYEIWQEFDPEATMYISYDHVPELLDVLEPPLQVKNSFSEIEKIFYILQEKSMLPMYIFHHQSFLDCNAEQI